MTIQMLNTKNINQYILNKPYSISNDCPNWAREAFEDGFETGLKPLMAMQRVASSPFFNSEWIEILEDANEVQSVARSA